MCYLYQTYLYIQVEGHSASKFSYAAEYYMLLNMELNKNRQVSRERGEKMNCSLEIWHIISKLVRGICCLFIFIYKPVSNEELPTI